MDANNAGWGSTQTLGLSAIALALIGAFYVIERRTKAPLVPFPGIFRIRTITGVNVTAVLVAASLFSMFFFISLYMQQVLGFSALEAGLAYLPLAVGIIITAGATAGLVTRFGFKPVLVSGLIITAAGLVWFSQVSPDGSYVSDVLFPSLLAAVGLGLAFVSMTVAAVSGVETHEAGLASGLINTSQQIGGALGLAILATIANGRTDDAVAAGSSAKVALTEGFQSAFTVGAGIAIVGAILAMVLVSGRASREHAEAAQRGERRAGPRRRLKRPEGGQSPLTADSPPSRDRRGSDPLNVAAVADDLALALALADDADALTLPAFDRGATASEKADGTPVTETDGRSSACCASGSRPSGRTTACSARSSGPPGPARGGGCSTRSTAPSGSPAASPSGAR